MNTDQKSAFDTIIASIEDLSENTSEISPPFSSCFFLQGPAGTGKTFAYNTLCNYLRGKRKVVACVASSGIAALLLPGGRTSHFLFKIPLDIKPNSSCFIRKNGEIAEFLSKTDLIIWDEVPMQNKLCFEAVDLTLQDIRSNDKLYGGIPVVFGGDFAQIPPVVKKANVLRL